MLSVKYLGTEFDNTITPAGDFEGYFMSKAPSFLAEYGHDSETYGLKAIYNEWLTNKAWLWDLFSRSQYWNGKGQIVISHDFQRGVDKKEVCDFFDWAYEQYIRVLPHLMWDEYSKLCTSEKWNYSYHSGMYYTDEESRKIGNFCVLTSDLEEIGFARFATADFAARVNQYCPEAKAVAGQKCSRIMGKVFKQIGLDKVDGYNQRFTRFADAINPLSIKRHTILSINPFDYWGMSFGNSWNSCHDIWKDRPKDKGNSTGYGGCYCSGTESYMLDGASIVFYTVDAAYDGDEFEFQPKVTRCMFHLGEDKIIQGRLYPQGNDVGAEDAYTETREIVQRLICEAAGATNLWKREKGCNACDEVTVSYGTHYTDYTYYENCSVSYWKGNGDNLSFTANKNLINIGHDPICPVCGEEHDYNEYLLCEDCRRPKCACCGETIPAGDAIEIDGLYYCRECVTWCEYHNRYELNSEHEFYNVRDCYGEICDEAIEEGDFVEVEDTESLRYYDPYARRCDVFETEDGKYYYSRMAMVDAGYNYDGTLPKRNDEEVA